MQGRSHGDNMGGGGMWGVCVFIISNSTLLVYNIHDSFIHP